MLSYGYPSIVLERSEFIS